MKLGRALVYLVSVWVLYAQHVAQTHVLAHVHPAASQQVSIAPESDRNTPDAGLCAFDATFCQLLFTAPGEDVGHTVLAARPVAALTSALTPVAFNRLHPPSRGPPVFL